MKKLLLGMIGVSLLDLATAQSGSFPGATPPPADLLPVESSLVISRTAPPDGVPNVVPALYTHVTTNPASKSYEWASLAILNNRSDFGANVTSYSKAFKLGNGKTWAGVMELQDATGRGGFFGLEIDAVTTGPSPIPGSQDGDRIGLGIVVGRAFNQGPKATVDYGIYLAPKNRDDREADVNFGMMIFAKCNYACYAMRAGNKIAFEETGQVANKFDATTGRWGLFNGDKPVFEIDVNTGELRVNGRPIAIEVQK